jgi:uncharacterized repeat protein (TIGR01451 family)
VIAAAAAVILALLVPRPALSAVGPATSLTLTTPYPGVSIAPGSRASFDLTVASDGPVRADLALGGVPDGWTAQVTGGGNVVTAVTADAEKPGTARLDVNVPANAAPNTYRLTVTATAGSLRDELEIDVVVAVDAGGEVTLTTDFPSLRGPASTNFSFNLTLRNDTAQDLTFGVNAQGPPGWTVTARPTSQSQAATFQVNAGATAGVTVTADPPPNVEAGAYPVQVTATAGERTVGGQLQVEVTGDFAVELTTPDGRLNANGPSGGTITRTLLVRNTGTGPLTEVSVTGTLPADWTATYEPAAPIAAIAPGDSAEVTARLVPAANAIAGDYVVTFRASAAGASTSDSADIRVTVETPLNWLVVGAGLILLVLLGLGWVFRRYGRR